MTEVDDILNITMALEFKGLTAIECLLKIFKENEKEKEND